MKRRSASMPLHAGLAAILIAAPFGAPGPAAAADISQSRIVGAFEHIRLTGALRAKITAGARATSVVVTTSPELADRVTTAVTDGTLVVGMKSGTNWLTHAPRLTIALPVLRGVANEGAGSIEIGGVDGGNLDITNAGAASIVIAGRATRVSIDLDGTGKIDTTALDARDVTVNNNGVGSVRVRVTGDLVAAVNGVGEIRYTGNPAHVDSQVNGFGRIGRL